MRVLIPCWLIQCGWQAFHMKTLMNQRLVQLVNEGAILEIGEHGVHYLYLLMEYCDGGSLLDAMQERVTEATAAPWITGVLAGLFLTLTRTLALAFSLTPTPTMTLTLSLNLTLALPDQSSSAALPRGPN